MNTNANEVKNLKIILYNCGADVGPLSVLTVNVLVFWSALILQDFQELLSEQAGNGCQYRVRPTSPSGEAGLTLPRQEDEPSPPAPATHPQQPDLQPHFALPPPTLSYEDYNR